MRPADGRALGRGGGTVRLKKRQTIHIDWGFSPVLNGHSCTRIIDNITWNFWKTNRRNVAPLPAPGPHGDGDAQTLRTQQALCSDPWAIGENTGKKSEQMDLPHEHPLPENVIPHKGFLRKIFGRPDQNTGSQTQFL